MEEIEKPVWLEKVEEIIAKEVPVLPVREQIEALNSIKAKMHEVSPFKDEPVDCILWVPNESLYANDYNPNAVAPPEMKLLTRSINADGYTQPIVSWVDEERKREVIDGFHRYRVGTENETVRLRVKGYLPVTTINQHMEGRGDRIASTIRHNRARGKHAISAMSDIVVELSKRNWGDKRIAKELGMDPDEVLRLKQITGLAELFADEEFSEAWESEQPNS